MILQPQVRVDALRRLQGRGRAGLHQGVPGGDREDRDQGEDGPEVNGLVFYAKKHVLSILFEFQTCDRCTEAGEVQASARSLPR